MFGAASEAVFVTIADAAHVTSLLASVGFEPAVSRLALTSPELAKF